MLLVISRTVGSAAALAAASVTALTTLTALSAAPAVAAAPRTAAPAVAAVPAPAASPAAVPAPAASPASVAAPPPVRDEDRAGGSGSRSRAGSGPGPGSGSGDRLTITVEHAGRGHDGTYELSCHPAAGSHPDPRGACAALDKNTRWGSEPFAPVPAGSVCTMLYGGPATARVTGTWAGRPVDATYNRSDGCQTARWNRMVPFLPDLGS
ncbi:SSI family serine proteinase inhibitor [Streptomyces sp. NPDC056161]|uniref:SSI family serine proteinase inhibitor n=1 Tax=Streptomyces sp. NPDC056161 TaxID=3345732 RepID=UPI0035DE3F3E